MLTVHHESWVATLEISIPETWKKSNFYQLVKNHFWGVCQNYYNFTWGGTAKWLQYYIGEGRGGGCPNVWAKSKNLYQKKHWGDQKRGSGGGLGFLTKSKKTVLFLRLPLLGRDYFVSLYFCANNRYLLHTSRWTLNKCSVPLVASHRRAQNP